MPDLVFAKPTIFEALAAYKYAFWIEATCPVCEEIVVNYHYTVEELDTEVREVLSGHEKWCKSPTGEVV